MPLPRLIHLAAPVLLLACVALPGSSARAANLFFGDVQDFTPCCQTDLLASNGLQQLSPHNIILGDHTASMSGGIGGAVSSVSRSAAGRSGKADALVGLDFRILSTTVGVLLVELNLTGLQFLTLDGPSSGRVSGSITGGFVGQDIIFPEIIWSCFEADCTFHESAVYFSSGMMPVNTTLRLNLFTRASSNNGGFARAFHDPIISFPSDPNATLQKLGNWDANQDFIMPVPEPGLGLLLLGPAFASLRRRQTRRP